MLRLRNGQVVWERTGPTHFDFDHGEGPYFKAGIYKGDPGWPGDAPSKTLSLDEFRLCDAAATYADLAP